MVGAVVLVMSATGVLLTYQRQITAWADRMAVEATAPTVDARRLPLEDIVRRAEAAHPGRPTAVKWHADQRQPVEVAFGREATLFVDAATGAVLGNGNQPVRDFFGKVVSLHRWLGGEGENRDRGKAITGASNLGFLFLVVSGLFLWWPRNWSARALRNVLWFRRGLSPKARDFNWHNVIGFWTLVPLFVVVLSGVVISYRWAGNLVYRSVGEVPPPERVGGRPAAGGSDGPATPVGLDALRPRAEQQVRGWRSISVQLGAAAGEPLVFNIDRGTGGQPRMRAQLTLAASTGEVVKWEPFSAGTPGRRLRSVLRFAHTGEIAGIPGQTVAGLASLGAVVLVWTGIALALRRFLRWRRGAGPGTGYARSSPRVTHRTKTLSPT